MKPYRLLLIVLVFTLVLSACAPAQTQAANTPQPAATVTSAVTATPVATATSEWFYWFSMPLTDVQTGKTFTMNDYAGKVVLLETIAMWCPNCLIQSGQVQKLHEALGNPEDLISITLDVDSNEDEATLKDYAASYGFNWHFAVAPLLLKRALGNLYSAQYLNPPLSPMLIIDREGNVHQLEYGLKEVATLQKLVEPYLAK
jgi:cytochrome oxidase Cu insertion factor (SCO1/SenC/PrrC family)